MQAQEAAARKEREQHEAAAAAARLSEATKKQEAASALLKQKQNQLLKGSRMALGVKQKPEVASQRRAVDKVQTLMSKPSPVLLQVAQPYDSSSLHASFIGGILPQL